MLEGRLHNKPQGDEELIILPVDGQNCMMSILQNNVQTTAALRANELYWKSRYLFMSMWKTVVDRQLIFETVGACLDKKGFFYNQVSKVDWIAESIEE